MPTKFSSLLAWAALASAGSFQPRAITSLDEAATAEAHQRDNGAIRAFSDVQIKTSDGRCLFVDQLSGDFRANLTPVQVAACGSTDGQGWDIITKGSHISGDNVMLIVSTLTQACFNFDGRRAPGNQVLLFTCGGRADGGGAVTDSQLFSFNGTTGPLSLIPQNQAGSCLAVKGKTIDTASCSAGDSSQSFTIGGGDTNSDLKAKRTNKKASSSTSCTKRTRTVIAAAAGASTSASVTLPVSEPVPSSSAPAQTTELLPDIDLSAAGTGKGPKNNKKAKKSKSSTASGATTKAAGGTTSAVDIATTSAIVESLSEVDLSTEGTAIVTSAAGAAKFTKKGKKAVKTKSTKIPGVATTVIETTNEAVTDEAAVSTSVADASTTVADITTTSASAQITESPSSIDLGVEDEITTITGGAGTTKITRKGRKGKKTKSSKTTATGTAGAAATDQAAASTTATDTTSVAATANATGATTSSAAAAATGGAGGILSANPTTPVPVSRAGGTLQPSAAAEAHRRDGAATRAFSNVSIRAPNGQCLFIDPTAGDFRQNLIPVSIVDCTGAPNEKWDIITAGKHNSATKATLVVSALTQGCISFDGRRDAGDTVTLFSCGGRADGGGETNSDQIFRYLGQLSFAFAPLAQNNKTCILPGDGRLDSGPCPTDGSQLYSIFP